VPQVYYVGLLAGPNDLALLQRSGVGRDINRHRYTPAEIAADLQRPVVQALLRLIRLRNEHPAFDGSFESVVSDAHTLDLRWQHTDHNGAHEARLWVNLATLTHELTYSGPQGSERLAGLAHPTADASVA
jgi:sucrose phosphorylase